MPNLNDISLSSDSLNTSWIKTPYGLKLAETPEQCFKTLLEMEKFTLAVDDEANGHTARKWMDVLEDANQTPDASLNKDDVADGNVFYSNPNYTDTRVGGNDAINPYWQFNIDDDIVPPSLQITNLNSNTDPEHGNLKDSNVYGMGRVYNETYDMNQQILWLSMGVPEYMNLLSFYSDAGDANAAVAMNKGTLRKIRGTIINLVFKATIWAITVPVLAPFWIGRWCQAIESDRITKYFSFKPAMVFYYEMVNTMLSYLAVSMGLYPQVITKRKDSSKVLTGQYTQMQFGVGQEESSANDSMYGVSAEAKKRIQEQHALEAANTLNSDTVVTQNRSENEVKEEEAILNELEKKYDTSNVDEDQRYSGSIVENPPDTGTDSYESGMIGDESTNDLLQKGAVDSGIPDILRYGPDIFSILNRRSRLFDAQRTNITTRQLLAMTRNEDQSMSDGKFFSTPNDQYQKSADGKRVEKLTETKSGSFAKLWSSFKSNLFGAGDYVGFRIDRGVSCNESVSNSTGQLGIAQKLNSYAQEQREKYENAGNSWIAKTAMDLAKEPGTAVVGIIKDLLGKTASAFGIGDIGAVLTQGNGFLDIPEVWRGSSFNRGYSFSVPLRARYGDPVSIYQSIYIPLCMLLCASMPRSVGNAMYTSPFLVKAYCKGMFSVPCGIIESLSITRGKDEFGWSNAYLPTSVDVSVTIKDLQPTFFLAMQDIGLFDTFTRNDGMMEYLDTLSALGITERTCMFPKAMRKLTAALLIKRNTVFSSTYWSMRVSRNNVVRALAEVFPYSNKEKTDANTFAINK